MNIKNELQGARGLFKKLRNIYMPHGIDIDKEAIKNVGYVAEKMGKPDARKNFNSFQIGIL